MRKTGKTVRAAIVALALALALIALVGTHVVQPDPYEMGGLPAAAHAAIGR